MSYKAQVIESLLGVKRAKFGVSPLALAYSVEAGFPVSALDKFAGELCPNDVRRFTYRVVPKPTLERRRRDKKPLTAEESDRLARIAKVFAFAVEIFHDKEKAREFLSRPHMMLDSKVPLDVALATGPGADVVMNLLGRAGYGGGV